MKSKSYVVCLALLGVLAIALPAAATPLQWGTDGAGGAGTWNTTSTNLAWYDGASQVAFSNTVPPYDVVFGGTAGAVTTVGTTLKVGDLNVTTPYTIALTSDPTLYVNTFTNSNNLTLTTVSATSTSALTMNVTSDTTFSGNLAMNASNKGVNLIKKGAGKLVYDGTYEYDSTVAGSMLVTEGQLILGPNFTNGSGTLRTNNFTLTVGASGTGVYDSPVLGGSATVYNNGGTALWAKVNTAGTATGSPSVSPGDGVGGVGTLTLKRGGTGGSFAVKFEGSSISQDLASSYIADVVSPTSYDQLEFNVTSGDGVILNGNNATYAPNLVLRIAPAFDGNVGAAQMVLVSNKATSSGFGTKLFANTPEGTKKVFTNAAGKGFQFNITYVGGTNANDLALDLVNTLVANTGGPYDNVDPVAGVDMNGSAVFAGAGTPSLTYAWDFDNNGSYEAAGYNAHFVNATPGVYTVGLQVVDSANNNMTSTGIGTVTVVPEPMTMALLALGGIGALCRRRR